ncbi:hypothetical protein ETAE_1333 [Edwardsiella piscicida]|uniref:Uncharacterized protein n=1 Tax=Edwardsiella piscicida TaxID=1263550 RepID=A0AAU8PM62_EDWPI|nr:hypothetical protein ETAE_1333 [Edwardsiella tarda EIB202]
MIDATSPAPRILYHRKRANVERSTPPAGVVKNRLTLAQSIKLAYSC